MCFFTKISSREQTWAYAGWRTLQLERCGICLNAATVPGELRLRGGWRGEEEREPLLFADPWEHIEGEEGSRQFRSLET